MVSSCGTNPVISANSEIDRAFPLIRIVPSIMMIIMSNQKKKKKENNGPIVSFYLLGEYLPKKRKLSPYLSYDRKLLFRSVWRGSLSFHIRKVPLLKKEKMLILKRVTSFFFFFFIIFSPAVIWPGLSFPLTSLRTVLSPTCSERFRNSISTRYAFGGNETERRGRDSRASLQSNIEKNKKYKTKEKNERFLFSLFLYPSTWSPLASSSSFSSTKWISCSRSREKCL